MMVAAAEQLWTACGGNDVIIKTKSYKMTVGTTFQPHLGSSNGSQMTRHFPMNIFSPTSNQHHQLTDTKGLLNGPGQNNCFLNCAVQVSPKLGAFSACADDAIQLNVYVHLMSFRLILRIIPSSSKSTRVRFHKLVKTFVDWLRRLMHRHLSRFHLADETIVCLISIFCWLIYRELDKPENSRSWPESIQIPIDELRVDVHRMWNTRSSSRNQLCC